MMVNKDKKGLWVLMYESMLDCLKEPTSNLNAVINDVKFCKLTLNFNLISSINGQTNNHEDRKVADFIIHN